MYDDLAALQFRDSEQRTAGAEATALAPRLIAAAAVARGLVACKRPHAPGMMLCESRASLHEDFDVLPGIQKACCAHSA